MKTLYLFLAILLSSLSLWAQTATITQASGWLESAYVEWKPVSGAQSYNVYCTGGGLSNQKLDNSLIRNYGTYLRADALGLKAGNYTLKIAPVIAGTEGTATTSSSLTVLPHDRSGFAFVNGRVPGAYNADGTPKSGAVIVYITEANKNTISMNVTGASTNPCVGLQTILDGFKKGKDNRPLIIRIIGQITDPTYLLGGDIVIENSNNVAGYITLEGVGKDAVADGWGIRLKSATNIEVRNMGIMNVNSSEGDNLGLQQDNEYVWVHHNDFFYGDAGSDADQAKGDGALDCKKSTRVTFSYNHFWDTGKSNLLGLSEGSTDDYFITYHHNWYDHSDSRHPRVRYYSAHVYNNYYDGNSKYGAGSTLGSSVFSESNYFRNCKYPMLTSMQGTDIWNENTQANDSNNMATFSKEAGGTIKAYNNYMEGHHRFVAYGATGFPNSTVDFDAYVASSRGETISNSVKSSKGGNIYNNFDTNPAVMYPYTPDSPADAKSKVMAYAGRTAGGDLRWTFNNAIDDASYAVNVSLKAALTTYKTTLVSVQGEGGVVTPSSSSAAQSSSSTGSSSSSATPSSSSIGSSSSSATPSSSSTGLSSSSATPSSSSTGSSSSSATGTMSAITTDVTHNFTTAGITSTHFGFIGNLSTSKGSVEYSGLTLTQCLKFESATQIAFILDGSATLTLVFNADFTGNVLIDGTSYTAQAGIATATLTAGSHTITKGASSNLFYMAIQFPNNTSSSSNTTSSSSSASPSSSSSDTASSSSESAAGVIQISTGSPIYFDLAQKTIRIHPEHRLRGIQVFGVHGNLQAIELPESNRISLARLVPGIYMVRIETEQGLFHRSIYIR